jgi:hypothetical protein
MGNQKEIIVDMYHKYTHSWKRYGLTTFDRHGWRVYFHKTLMTVRKSA